jgi:hypothetical protein
MSATKIVLALSSLCAVSVATQSNSDVCTTAANYDAAATATMMSSDCDTAIPVLISSFLASDISACSSTYVTGTTLTEAYYIQQMSTDCCTDGIGPCDPDHSAMCADPTQYSGSASSPVEGCTPGATNCDSAGYWTCDGVADVYAMSMGTTGWADCSTTIPSGSTSTWAETTQMLGSTCCVGGDSVCGAWDTMSGAKTTAVLSGLVASFAFVTFSALL